MQKFNKTPDIKSRTVGDGMDNSLIHFSEVVTKNLRLNLSTSSNSHKPIIPEGPIIKTVPKYIPKDRKKPRYLTKKPKEPKFVPYEPFKGAVEPIIPKKRTLLVTQSPQTRNNVDIQDLVFQMAEMRSSEINKIKSGVVEGKITVIPMQQWEEEKNGYEMDIKNLRETNAHLENQLKFQGQVNSELKTLLVAAVGEDLESRVQHLTEDKLQLARALLNSANHLTSHQEQTEWLSGQCEVWRSKFLASSLMVEELARWKSALSNRINDLQDTLKVLIEERGKVRDNSLRIYNLLYQINQTVNPETDYTKPRSANILDLTLNNHNLSESIARRLVKDVTFNEDLLKLPTNTPGENLAVRILKNPVSLLAKPDAVCNALMGAAMSMTGGQLFLQHPTSHATCCKHCKGEVVNI